MKEFLKNEHVVNTRDYALFNQYADLSNKPVKISNFYNIDNVKNKDSISKIEKFVSASSVKEGLFNAYGIRSPKLVSSIEFFFADEKETVIELNLCYLLVLEAMVLMFNKNEEEISKQWERAVNNRKFIAEICCLHEYPRFISLMNLYLTDEEKVDLIDNSTRHDFINLFHTFKDNEEKVTQAFIKTKIGKDVSSMMVLANAA